MKEKMWDLRNPSGTREIKHDGKCLSFERWSEITGIPKTTIEQRFYKGLPLEDVFYKGRLPRPKED